MCGLIGEISLQGQINKHYFESKLNLIHHRGPDDKGSWFSQNNRVALGSVRLAIIDLSKNGHMPMHDAFNQIHIVFNGEIYNFKEIRKILLKQGHLFTSDSDTEVILRSYLEWGEAFISKLNGMFAIAIFDEPQNKLYLYRDRAGEKPLYYYHSSDLFAFGSELRVLSENKSIKKFFNYGALNNFLQYGYCNVDETLINNIKKLPAAHYLVFDININQEKISKYWEPPVENINLEYSNVLGEELEQLLEKAVSQQMVSDVPLGILLSGGVDSSLVTAMAARNSPNRIKTFHIHFDGLKQYDERPYASLVAKYFDTEHYELSGSAISLEHLDAIFNHIDEPLGDSSLLPTFLVAELTKKYVTVALGGDGGDELFGGYSHYTEIVNRKFRKNLKSLAASHFAEFLPIGFKGRQFLKKKGFNTLNQYLTAPFFFDQKSIDFVFTKDFRHLLNSMSGFDIPTGFRNYDPLSIATRYDFIHYLCDDILVKVDRMSMAHSLEMRAPWLDIDIIEFAFSKVPSTDKTIGQEKKILPKILATKILPKELDIQRKQGFSIPLSNWMVNKWKPYFQTIFKSADPNIFNIKNILILLEKEKKSFYNNNHRLFALAGLIKWMQKSEI